MKVMIRIMMNNIKTGLVVLGLFLMVGVLTLTFAFTDSKSANKGRVTHYFQFTGTPGNEANKALWENVTTLPDCNGSNGGCLIEVPASFTVLSGTSLKLTQNVPVVTVGFHKNPDTDNPMILNAINKIP